MQIDALSDLVRAAARKILLPRFGQVKTEAKQDGSLVTEADLLMQRELAGSLQKHWPLIALLGEEMTPAEQAALLGQASSRIWVLDPLDGTINFASGVPNFAVSLALLDGAGVQLGLIYDPVRDEIFSASRDAGANLNGRPLRLPRDKPRELEACVAEIDLKRLDEQLRLRLVREMPFRSQRNFGSGALDWAWLADGRYQLYLHGGQKLWDYAAGSLILAEAGGAATTLAQQPLFNGSMAPRSAVGAVNLQLQEEWLAWLTRAE
jgi:myo-inositol-1(or 4)-monophosphatase